jgi:hypothetical protein
MWWTPTQQQGAAAPPTPTHPHTHPHTHPPTHPHTHRHAASTQAHLGAKVDGKLTMPNMPDLLTGPPDDPEAVKLALPDNASVPQPQLPGLDLSAGIAAAVPGARARVLCICMCMCVCVCACVHGCVCMDGWPRWAGER